MKQATYIFFLILFIFQNVFAQTPGTLKWDTPSWFNLNSPAIGSDGTVYTVTDSMILSAINPDGNKKWEFETVGSLFSAPMVGQDGTVFIVSDKLYAIWPDGTQNWDYPAAGSASSLSSDGTIYISSNNGLLYAINPDGTLKWEFQATNDIGPTAIAEDGTVYFASNKTLFALYPDGTKKWILESDSKIKSAPALGAEGVVYLVTENGILAVNPDGTFNWKNQIPLEINSSLIIGQDGVIYGTSSNYLLYAFNPNGTKKWQFQIDSSYSTNESSTPAIGSNGILYVGLGDTFFAINPDESIKWEFNLAGPISSSSPAIAPDGTIYFNSWGGKFYAIYSESSGLANSPWPKFRGNNQNQASIYNENCPVAKVVESHFSLKNGGQVTLDASPSYDPDGDALSYLWLVVEMSQGSPITLSDSTSAVITVDIPGGQFASYRFSLKVTDNDDGSSWLPVFVNTGKKWEFKTGRGVYASPAIGQDGTVYIISDKVYAINDEGATKWRFETRGSHLAIGADGTIFVSSWDDILYALNSNGDIIWEFDEARDVEAIAIGSEGTIYFSTEDYGNNSLFAINPDGTKKWVFEMSQYIGPPVVGADGTIYFCSIKKLFALNPNSEKIWSVDIGQSYDSPVIDNDGTIYINSPDHIYAVNPDGTIKWTARTGSGSISSSPVIGSDGTIYGGSDKLYAVNPNGTKKWEFETSGVFSSSPAIGSDGTIFIGSRDSTFYAVNPDGTEKWSFKTGGSVFSSPAVGNDGAVYFGSGDSTLYAICSESSGLADSPWPKYGKNNQNRAGSYNENCPRAKVTNDFISIESGGQVTLDGSNSYDPDGEALSYLWRIVEKPPGSSVVLNDSTAAIITVDIPEGLPATYRFALIVTDNDDGYSSKRVTVSTALKWEFDLSGQNEYVSSPSIASDGTVYMRGDSGLVAINPEGTEKWKFSINDDVYSVSFSAIASNGTIYTGINNTLYAVNPDGTMKWEYEISDGVFSTPAIASDGTLYISSMHKGFGFFMGLHSVNADGTRNWKAANITGYGRHTPSIGQDGTIYISAGSGYTSLDYYLMAINPDSSVKWFIQSEDGYPFTSPAIGIDGTLYVRSGALFALNPDGSKIWKFDSGSLFVSSPAIGADGTLYAATQDSFLYAVNPDGTEKWALSLDFISYSTPAVGSDGTIFIGSGNGGIDGKFYAINSDGTEKWESATGDYSSSSPAISSDGTVYIGSAEGKLSAFNSSCNGLAESPWPKARKDNQNTSNAFNENCPIAKVAEQHFVLKNGGEITLDASPSSDPDGNALSFLWRVVEMNQNKPVTLSDSTSAVININIPSGHPAYYRFSLKVTDNQDGSSWIPLFAETGQKWQFQITNEQYSTPVISQDGTIHFASTDSIYAINPDGTKRWSISSIIGDHLTISSTGVIYAQSGGDRFSAFTPKGVHKWTFIGDADIGRGFAIDGIGTIYIGFGDKLCAIDSSGLKKWEFPTNSNYTSLNASSITSDGTIYLCSGNKLFAVRSNGTKKWEYGTEYTINTSPVIATDGTIYIYSGGQLLAVNPNGTGQWESPSLDETYYSPAIGLDNTIYLGTSNGLYALNPDDGNVKWLYAKGRFTTSSPAIGADGTIYICLDNYYGTSGPFYAINPDGTEKWHFNETVWGSSSPVIDADGIIYFTSGYSLYALHSESGGLADSPWPKYRHDNQNTGNVLTQVTSITQIKTDIPKKYALFPNYPNPFNPLTKIKFSLPKPGKVQINVYNILGQRVAKLLDAKKSAGTYNINWDASKMSSGMYFIRLESDAFVKVRKCLLIK